jgi:Tfp pilus assembly protein PilX
VGVDDHHRSGDGVVVTNTLDRVLERARDERGFTVIVALAALLIALLLASAALTFSLRSVSSSQQDRRETLAGQAADAGADLAVWRMNKILVPNDVFSPQLFGYTSSNTGGGSSSTYATIYLNVETVGCLNFNSSNNTFVSLQIPSPTNPPAATVGTNGGATSSLEWCAPYPSAITGTCAAGGAEIDNGTSYPQFYSYQISNAINIAALTGSSAPLLERRVIVTGCSGNVQRRLLVKAKLALGANNVPTSLFQRYFTVECTSTAPDPTNPDSGCPDPNN